MPGFNGTGPRGMGSMTGGGRGFCSPWGRGAYQRGYGVPRMGYGNPYYGAWPVAPGNVPFALGVSREQELGFLQQQAQVMKEQLGQIEVRIQEITTEKK
ncbi:MAG: DUF5320 domain-containing protein [Dehalococcoidales bacterium]|nr:DUF5320 domain-containing protein [Dehalococcoidales bacterium]